MLRSELPKTKTKARKTEEKLSHTLFTSTCSKDQETYSFVCISCILSLVLFEGQLEVLKEVLRMPSLKHPESNMSSLSIA